MPPKVYKWQKRSKNNKHEYTQDVARGGGAYGVFYREAQNLKLRHWHRVRTLSAKWPPLIEWRVGLADFPLSLSMRPSGQQQQIGQAR